VFWLKYSRISRKWNGSNTLVDCPRNWKSKSRAYGRNQIRAVHLRPLRIDRFTDNSMAATGTTFSGNLGRHEFSYVSSSRGRCTITFWDIWDRCVPPWQSWTLIVRLLAWSDPAVRRWLMKLARPCPLPRHQHHHRGRSTLTFLSKNLHCRAWPVRDLSCSNAVQGNDVRINYWISLYPVIKSALHLLIQIC